MQAVGTHVVLGVKDQGVARDGFVGIGLLYRQVGPIFGWLAATGVFPRYRQVSRNFDRGRTGGRGVTTGTSSGARAACRQDR